MSDLVLIRYTYPGTVGGKPVGDVYVQKMFGGLAERDDIFSYTKDPLSATATNPERAEDLIRQHRWPNARPVPRIGAEALP